MAARKPKKRTYRRPGFKIINAALAWGQLSILTEGALGSGPIGVLTDMNRIPSYSSADRGFLRRGRPTPGGGVMSVAKGAQVVGLGDMIEKPEDSLAVVIGNVRNNAIPMFISSAALQIGGKMFKTLFRSNISAANRVIMKPIFGRSVSL